MYSGKVILAPMVRMGTLPTRLLALSYGADLVFTPEIIDRKLVQCVRRENVCAGHVDFLVEGDKPELVMRLHKSERPNLVLQIGTADPECAVRAAQLAQNDVAGVDVNCGCPKRFSVHAGMGSALLRNPDLLISILKALCIEQPLPVSAKIRILSNLPDTLALCNHLWGTGIHAITVHGRTPQQRYETAADWEAVRAIKAAAPPGKTVILNGDVFSPADLSMALGTGCDGVMVARAAQNNLSVFAALKGGEIKTMKEVSVEYIRMAMKHTNSLQNSKYCLMQAWVNQPKDGSVRDLLKRLYVARSYSDLCALFNINMDSVSIDECAVEMDDTIESGYTAEKQAAHLSSQMVTW